MPAISTRVARSIVGAIAVLLITTTVVLGHTPTAGSGAADQYPKNTTLFWQFEAYTMAWPTSWATPAIQTALNNGSWANASFNDSRMPNYVQSTSGQGRIRWTNQTGSPCSGDIMWLGCNPSHLFGALNWVIYVRDITNAPGGLPAGSHWEEHPSASGPPLFLMKRVALHEAIHNVLSRPHDGQSTVDTIMQATSPSVTAPGGLTMNIQRCDEAAAQLEYGVKTSTSRFAACFDHIPNAGTLGLKTKLNVASPDLTKCLNQQMQFTGTLTVGLDGTNYEELSGQVLGGKTVRLERRPTSGGSWVPEPP